MTDLAPPDESIDAPVDDYSARAELLEQKLSDLQRLSDMRLIRAEMKAEAIRAGMIDLDGLKLLDLSSITLNESGEVDNASELMARFKKAKPWLFSTLSSSRLMVAPPAVPPHQKHASEMSVSEYAVAKATLLKQRY